MGSRSLTVSDAHGGATVSMAAASDLMMIAASRPSSMNSETANTEIAVPIAAAMIESCGSQAFWLLSFVEGRKADLALLPSQAPTGPARNPATAASGPQTLVAG